MLNRRKIKFLNSLVLVCLLISGSFLAQNKNKGKLIELLNADRLKYVAKLQAKRLLGNVIFKHENTTLNCDSAYLYDNNTLEAFSNVVIRKGDSLTITGSKLHYDGNTKLGFLEGNVVCIDKDMTLTTSALNYDGNKNIVSYYNGANIVSKNNTLTSRNGHYYTQTRDLWFRYNVELKNPEYTLTGDTLRYNTLNKTTYFLGPTKVKGKQNSLYCENGWYNTQTQVSWIYKNAHINSGKNELYGDSIYYNKKSAYGKVLGHVMILDTAQKVKVFGGKAEHFELKGISIVTDHPVFMQQNPKDSLFLTADTLFSIEKQDTAAYRKMKTDSTIIANDTSEIKAFHNVKIMKKDLFGICDSLFYSSVDSTMTLYRNPVLWEKNSQLTAKEIKIVTGKKSIRSFQMTGNAFIIEEVDSGLYNQIRGKEVFGFFEGDSLRKINVKGNCQVYYYVKNDKKKIIGLNQTDCSEINAYLRKSEINKITFIKKPKSVVYPIQKINPSDHRLKGFLWVPEKKPLPNDFTNFINNSYAKNN